MVELIVRAEAAAGAVVRASAGSGHGEPSSQSAREAIRAAVAVAQEGGRASALIGADEILDALPALREAAALRAPILVHAVERRGGPAVGRDELVPALDAGAGVLVTWSAQDAADITLSARRAAEDSETPFFHLYDGPAAGGAPGQARPPAPELPTPELAARFLDVQRPPRARLGASSGAPSGLPIADDAAEGAPRLSPEVARKRAERGFAARVPFALAGAMRQLGELTGRPAAPVERWETADAEEIVVAVGSAAPPAFEAVRSLRAQGRRVGLVAVRALRPFYGPELVKSLGRASAVVVIEPYDVALAPCGPLAAACKAALADALTWAPGYPGIGRIPPIISASFATLSGPNGPNGAITERDVRLSIAEIASGERARRVVVLGSDG